MTKIEEKTDEPVQPVDQAIPTEVAATETEAKVEEEITAAPIQKEEAVPVVEEPEVKAEEAPVQEEAVVTPAPVVEEPEAKAGEVVSETAAAPVQEEEAVPVVEEPEVKAEEAPVQEEAVVTPTPVVEEPEAKAEEVPVQELAVVPAVIKETIQIVETKSGVENKTEELLKRWCEGEEEVVIFQGNFDPLN